MDTPFVTQSQHSKNIDVFFVGDPHDCKTYLDVPTLRKILGTEFNIAEYFWPTSELVAENPFSVMCLSSPRSEWSVAIESFRKRFSRTFLVLVIEPPERIDSLLETDVNDIFFVPTNVTDIIQRIRRILRLAELSDVEKLKRELRTSRGLDELVGKSKVYLECIGKIPLMGESDSPLLICGDSGTGKEVYARAVHYVGKRAHRPFIPVNCAAIPDSLFENELFGHEKGAYTDASRTQPGILSEANAGTLFLDEIDSLSMMAQSKLLRFVEEKRFKSLGSSTYTESDVRLICATNHDLSRQVAEGRFRDDLLYRINVLSAALPRLRDRAEDIPLLVDYFLEKFSRQNLRGQMYVQDQAMTALQAYPWPGNIRELRNMMEKLVVMSPSNIIRTGDVPLGLPGVDEKPQPYEEARRKALDQFERNYIGEILDANHGNITRSAECARISRRTVQRLVQKYDLLPTVTNA